MKLPIRKHGDCRAAFTRRELLASISVVVVAGLLIALGIAQARRKSTSYHCLQNLKRVGVAMQAYAGDNQSRLPYAFINANDQGQSTWDHRISSYLKVGRRGEDANQPATIGTLLKCPADKVSPVEWAAKNNLKRRSYSMTRHSMETNCWPPSSENTTGVGLWWGNNGPSNALARNLSKFTNGLPSIRVDMVLSPGFTLMVTEQARSNNIVNNSSGASIRSTEEHLETAVIPPQQYHKGRFNYLMVDGRATTLYPEETVGKSGQTGKDPQKHQGMWTIRSGD